ncbi:IS607 family transposase [Saccharopolyspora erythraea]|uniref:IS607 family transposase n=1 Tax=Saccharopolyspora erythraea TaxID=1836 RepID=UPI001BA4C934|nr:IS607 family transposase [Saccharopolyspora erythraea]QUH00783.1 IS607 family transposase [Saccharopolyspora erythraea]
MKLKEWAREQGVSYRTALNWFHAGTLPVPARQLPTGTILVETPTMDVGKTVAYCRVSSADQRDDLERQAGRVAEECGKRGIALDGTVTEVGSGLDGSRAKLRKLLSDPAVARIVVEHRDRLARFGVEDLEAALAATGRVIVVLNAGEVKDDLERDMVEVLASMCARLYGRRSARRRAEAGVRCATAAKVPG